MFIFYKLLCLFCLILCYNSILLLRNVSNVNLRIKYLMGSVLIFALLLLIRTSVFAGEFLPEYPHFMKVFSPIGFLIFPLFYLAIKYAINEGQYFKKTDLHFIPAFIHFLELIPLYMLSKSEKLVLLEELFFDMYAIVIFVHGLIPGIWIELFRLALMIFYFIMVVGLVFNFKRKEHSMNLFTS
jgi:hypothetical protein